MREGQPFSAARLDGDASTIEDFYRRQGFAGVVVQADEEPAPHEAAAAEVPVTVRIEITENVRTVVNSVRVEGNPAVPEAALRSAMGLQPGRPFFLTQMALDRDVIQQQYANLGFQSATVDSNPGLSADRARADVVFTVHEGPRLLIDHVLIVGNVRTKTETIERELQFKPGDPLGLAVVNDAERRLAGLGLFRRTTITAIGHGEDSRDVLISVVEAPVTSIGYGVGVEAQELSQGTEANGGIAEQRLEFAPRAFFEIGRRNLFGKNRSVNLFTRLSLRPKDSAFFANQRSRRTRAAPSGSRNIACSGTFREPHVFGTSADAVVTGTLEQQVRSSFDFARHALSLEVGRRVTRDVSVSGNYQLQRIRLFNDSDRLVGPAARRSGVSAGAALVVFRLDHPKHEGRRARSHDGHVPERERPAGGARDWIGDRPAQVVHAGAVVPHHSPRASNGARDQRDARADRRLAARCGPEGRLGGGGPYHSGQRAVLRRRRHDGARLRPRPARHAQHHRSIQRVPDRRQRARDLQRRAARAVSRSLQFVGFIDTGNVFARASDIDLGELRSAVGFGIRYKSPIGPIRVDVGFKTHREDIVAGTPESLMALHISLGQAF